MLTPSPKMSPSLTMTSPTLMPMRKRSCRASSSGLLAMASCCWMSVAHWTASKTLANSASTLSPAVPAMRPLCWAISSSVMVRCADRVERALLVDAPSSGCSLRRRLQGWRRASFEGRSFHIGANGAGRMRWRRRANIFVLFLAHEAAVFALFLLSFASQALLLRPTSWHPGRHPTARRCLTS